MSRPGKYIAVLSVVHIVIAVGLFAALAHYGPGTESIGKDTRTIMLEDDGYYKIAGDLVRHGMSLLHRRMGPGLPLVYSVIYLFADPAHPYVRWLLTTAATIFTLVLVWRVVKIHLTPAEFFVGSLVTVLNPAFIHWSFKSQPDTFVGLLLVLSTSFLLKALDTRRNSYLLYAALSLLASILIRPSVLFVAPMLAIVGVAARWKRLLAYALVLALVSTAGFEVNKRICSVGSLSYASGVTTFVCDAYEVEEILKQGRIEVQTHNSSEEALSGPGHVAMARTTEWMERYGAAHPGASGVRAALDFTRANPGMVIRKSLLNPVFFFALGSRTIEFYVYLSVTLASLLFVVWGVRMVGVDRRLLVVIGVICGYVAEFVLVHGLSRYSIAVLPLLYVYSGKSLVHVAGRLRKRALSPAN